MSNFTTKTGEVSGCGRPFSGDVGVGLGLGVGLGVGVGVVVELGEGEGVSLSEGLAVDVAVVDSGDVDEHAATVSDAPSRATARGVLHTGGTVGRPGIQTRKARREEVAGRPGCVGKCWESFGLRGLTVEGNGVQWRYLG